MNSVEFCYWLQGYFEILDGAEGGPIPETLSPKQVQAIKSRLGLVLDKVTPKKKSDGETGICGGSPTGPRDPSAGATGLC